jgi:excisionase family DNA binding protein
MHNTCQEPNTGRGEDNIADEYLGIDELAALLGITRKSAYQRVARGQIPHRKWGRKLVFVRAEIVAFLDSLPGPRPADVRKRWGS